MTGLGTDVLARSAERIADDIAALSAPAFTRSDAAICRYAYGPEYMRTLEWLSARLTELGFTVGYDPVGTLVARNRPPGAPVFAVGSHCDSNRNGGRFDGTLGVVGALELCRRSAEDGLDLPLQVIAWLEEEGSGFGEMLLGSRICAGLVDAQDLRSHVYALDDGRSFAEHAAEAGFRPEACAESARILDDAIGWLEMHIEQGRVLQDHGERLGIVHAISGYTQGDLEFGGRADHAGATPMDLRADAFVPAASCAVAAERLARDAGSGTVATVGEVAVQPGLVNVIPARATISYDVRGVDGALFAGVRDAIVEHGRAEAAARAVSFAHRERQHIAPVAMDRALVDLLAGAAARTGAAWRRMPSGAAHDTMCVAPRVPSAMLFIPCRDGISHDPAEHAEPADAALAVDVMYGVIRARLSA